MKTFQRLRFALVANVFASVFVSILTPVLSSEAIAQSVFPDKPIKLIVPFPPGGGTDIIGRIIADKLNTTQGWKIVIENKAGAGGTLGLDAAAKSRPDGYTLVIGQTSNMSIAPFLMSGLPYDPLKDLKPVTLVSEIPLGIVVGADSPIKTFADLIDAAKRDPGKVLFASPGNATVAHLAGMFLQKIIGIKYKHIPYKGTAQALPDVISSRATFFVASVESVGGPVKAGQLRPIAVTSTQRYAQWPDVPTVAELGFPDFSAGSWFGVAVPAGTPDLIVEQLNTEITKVLQFPDVKERLGGAVPTGPNAFATTLKKDIDKWREIIKEAGINPI